MFVALVVILFYVTCKEECSHKYIYMCVYKCEVYSLQLQKSLCALIYYFVTLQKLQISDVKICLRIDCNAHPFALVKSAFL